MSEAIPSDQPLPIRASARQIVEASGLPPQACALILGVAKRTRLWKREKAEVAHELVAHFRDGLEAGRSAEDLVATFGQPKVVAKLIARGKKRNRPLWWHLNRRMGQAVLLLVAFYIGAGLALALRHPRISVDYLAEINKNIPSLPQDQYAWPIYRKALIEEREKGLGEINFIARDGEGASLHRDLRPSDPGWPRAIVELEKHKALLEAARAGGLKPALGLKLGFARDFSAEDARAFGWTTRPAAGDATDELVLAALLPHLGSLREMAELLMMDAWRASVADDPRRVLQDYRAAIGLARQAREVPAMINGMVAIGILELADETLRELLEARSDALRGIYVPLLHEMGSAAPLYEVDVAGERCFLLDVIQRVYSDNGYGDGTVTLDGVLLLKCIRPMVGRGSDDPGQRGLLPPERELVTMPPLLPAAATLMASRREVTAKAQWYFAEGDRDARRPLWERLRNPANLDDQLVQWKKEAPVRYLLLAEMLPPLDRFADRFSAARALHEATMVALALDLWHERHGQYPDSLAEMVSEYLPQVPVDHSTGQPLRYKIKEGKPLLYGLGKDGKDDGGVWQDKHWPRLPEKGDWVLYPPVEAE